MKKLVVTIALLATLALTSCTQQSRGPADSAPQTSESDATRAPSTDADVVLSPMWAYDVLDVRELTARSDAVVEVDAPVDLVEGTRTDLIG